MSYSLSLKYTIAYEIEHRERKVKRGKEGKQKARDARVRVRKDTIF